jgi:hypothetical protein
MTATATIVFIVLALLTLGNETQISIYFIFVVSPKVARQVQSVPLLHAVLLPAVLQNAFPD